ncbi:MAG: Co2+/Mg2+ efflux protein ApaG [Haliscomenobacter sp.]
MESMTTNGIQVRVECSYQPNYSNPLEHKFIYAYRITIENLSDATVQLLRRHWHIHESTGVVREIEGEGVIGRQPVLNAGETHQYVSWTHLQTGIGKMKGAYQMLNCDTGDTFSVSIPEFHLVAPFLLN